ncbi:MAG: ABC transporter substrate-binding protein [Bacteroidetes bacterium]|nr:ABC transporter substrate-binding protein [Bacteroidota bacterium]
MRYIIGIDDTDNLDSRGTGHRARMMGLGLMKAGLGKLENITRHQLFVSPLIPYTSHNSSASLVVSDVNDPIELTDFCRVFLVQESAEGSDAGLCVAAYDQVDKDLQEWGRKAKSIVLTMDEAISLAQKNNICLEGLTGEKCGIIGSLAAVGLRKEGNDGRLLWMPNLRETKGIFKVSEVFALLSPDAIIDMEGKQVSAESKVELTDWSRPVMRGNKITLILQPCNKDEEADYTSAPKEFIKSISG